MVEDFNASRIIQELKRYFQTERDRVILDEHEESALIIAGVAAFMQAERDKIIATEEALKDGTTKTRKRLGIYIEPGEEIDHYERHHGSWYQS